VVEEIAYDCVMTNRTARLHYSRALRAIRVALEANPRAYMEKLRQEEIRRQRAGTLIHRIQTRCATLLFRAALTTAYSSPLT
jgi:hypothetical protein